MYTIGEAAARSGVSVPLLRAWERRYGVVTPRRTAIFEDSHGTEIGHGRAIYSVHLLSARMTCAVGVKKAALRADHQDRWLPPLRSWNVAPRSPVW